VNLTTKDPNQEDLINNKIKKETVENQCDGLKKFEEKIVSKSKQEKEN
jgi:hypothetical protein